MKANVGDKIKLIKDVCYGTVHGLVKVPKGTEMTVIKRNLTDDGVITDLIFESKNIYFPGTINVDVWDKDYILIS